MKVIICGGGQVGFNIAAYLCKEDNSVTVIDNNPAIVNRINDELDANGIIGHAADPNMIMAAGGNEAEMLVAVTYSDEVNMVACQVAHSLFKIPKKIARIRRQSFRDPAWSNLFSRDHMPIDAIISPEAEIARAIAQRLTVPGTFNVIPFAEGKVYLVGVICQDNCPIVNTPLRQLTTLFPDLAIEIVAIAREGKQIIPRGDDQMYYGDEVYFVVENTHLQRALAAFGHEEKPARNVLIIGGGNVGLSLSRVLEQSPRCPNLHMIEYSDMRATYVSETLEKTIVIQGDALDQTIMEEANIQNTQTVVSVTNNDETNILASLLAKQYGVERTITLVNKPDYSSFITSLGVDAIVSPKAITVSTILRHVRRGHVKMVHNLRDGFAEVMEVEALDGASVISVPIKDLDFPKRAIIGAIVRRGQVIIPKPDDIIQVGDHVILLAAQGQAQHVEKMFSVSMDFF